MTKKLLIALLAAFVVVGCEEIQIEGQDWPQEDNGHDGNNGSGDENGPEGTGDDDSQDVSDSDDSGDVLNEADFTKIIDIVWNGSEVSVTNGTALAVSTDGAHVVVGASGAAGEKVRINMSGTSDNGSLKIYNGVKDQETNKQILLSMGGVSLTSKVGPAINIQSGKTVFVLLKGENTLKDVNNYTNTIEGEDAKGCFFSEKQLVFSGDGKLTVTGLYKHAICVDDYFRIFSGEIEVKSASSDGIHVNEYFRVDGGKITVNSKGEAIQCEEAEVGYFYMKNGEISLTTSDSKSGGIETASDIIIDGGKITITTNGTSAKCLKSDNNICINGGELTLKTVGGGSYDSTTKDTSASACIRAENNVVLKGGNISCTSTGNGGKGINCYKFECEDGVVLSVSTSGGVYSYSNLSSRPKAIKATKQVTINGGKLDVKTTGTEGEGIESKDAIEINGGQIVINAKDDGINAAGVITFNGGYVYAYSTGNDGIDTNAGKSNSIVVNGGVVIAHSATSPEEAFDADNHAYLTFNGGYVFCTGGQQGGGGRAGGWPGGGGGGWPGGGGGGSGTPTCTQPTAYWNSAASKGYFTLTDASGKVVMSCYVPRALSTNYSFISAPMTAGASYKCGYTTSAPTGATEVFGTYFYADGTVSGTLSKSFTAPSGYSAI